MGLVECLGRMINAEYLKLRSRYRWEVNMKMNL
jgi:hypothetical protein